MFRLCSLFYRILYSQTLLSFLQDIVFTELPFFSTGYCIHRTSLLFYSMLYAQTVFLQYAQTWLFSAEYSMQKLTFIFYRLLYVHTLLSVHLGSFQKTRLGKHTAEAVNMTSFSGSRAEKESLFKYSQIQYSFSRCLPPPPSSSVFPDI